MLRSAGRLAAEMARAGAAGRRRQHGLAIVGAVHRSRDPRVQAHRLALLRVPPRPFPDDLQAIGRRARGREQRDLLDAHRGVQILVLAHERFRKSAAQLALADRRNAREPAVDVGRIGRRLRTVAIQRHFGHHAARLVADAPPMCSRIAHVFSAGNVRSIVAVPRGGAANTGTGSPRARILPPLSSDERAAARHPVRLGFALQLPRAHGRERACLGPAVGLAVTVERARRQAQAFVRLGLVVSGVRARPANPALAEHDRPGRHSCKYDTASRRCANVCNELRAAQDIHSGFHVAAADENEVDALERFASRSRSSRRRFASFGQTTSGAPAAAISAHSAGAERVRRRRSRRRCRAPSALPCASSATASSR